MLAAEDGLGSGLEIYSVIYVLCLAWSSSKTRFHKDCVYIAAISCQTLSEIVQHSSVCTKGSTCG